MLRDRFGNVLLRLRPAIESDLPHLASTIVMPASLVVVDHAGQVLLVFDSWRKQWEIPGGRREGEESWRETARRELFEETGIADVELTFAALAEFRLVDPDRLETLAIYRTTLDRVPQLVINPEVEAFQWWRPADAVTDDMSPLDTAIARYVMAEVGHDQP